jgi:hypothetical protein
MDLQRPPPRVVMDLKANTSDTCQESWALVDFYILMKDVDIQRSAQFLGCGAPPTVSHESMRKGMIPSTLASYENNHTFLDLETDAEAGSCVSYGSTKRVQV